MTEAESSVPHKAATPETLAPVAGFEQGSVYKALEPVPGQQSSCDQWQCGRHGPGRALSNWVLKTASLSSHRSSQEPKSWQPNIRCQTPPLRQVGATCAVLGCVG